MGNLGSLKAVVNEFIYSPKLKVSWKLAGLHWFNHKRTSDIAAEQSNGLPSYSSQKRRTIAECGCVAAKSFGY